MSSKERKSGRKYGSARVTKRKKKLGSITKFWGESGPGWPLMNRFMIRDRTGNFVYTAENFLNTYRKELCTLLSEELEEDKVWVKLDPSFADDELAVNNLRDVRRKVPQPPMKVSEYGQYFQKNPIFYENNFFSPSNFFDW